MRDAGVTKLFLGDRTEDKATRNIHVKRGFATLTDGKEKIGETVDWYSEGAQTQAELLARQQFVAGQVGESAPAPLLNSQRVTAPSEEHATASRSAAHDPNINGAWYWRAKSDQGTTPRGLLLITTRDDRTISGLSVTEIPVRDVTGKIAVVESMKPFTGTITSQSDTTYHITFQTLGGQPDDVGISVSEADLDLQHRTLSGKTMESLGADKKLTYRWEATR